MAATWNPELMKRAREIAAVENSGRRHPLELFTGGSDIGRQPLWPRVLETVR